MPNMEYYFDDKGSVSGGYVLKIILWFSQLCIKTTSLLMIASHVVVPRLASNNCIFRHSLNWLKNLKTIVILTRDIIYNL